MDFLHSVQSGRVKDLDLTQLTALVLDMDLFKAVITHVSPIFLATSPVTSFADQIYSIHRSRSSAGFSLDIPLIMLMASITKVFYWFGTHYELSLLIQAWTAIIIHLILLHVALTNRALPNPTKDLHAPFSTGTTKRPYEFWQWRSVRPYWMFLVYFTVTLATCQVLLGSVRTYVNFIGYMALAVEAVLPLPQIISNHQNRSCKGFRLSVLVNWLLGDAMKMSFFFLSENPIPWPFKLCGLFQWACDIYLGIQYVQFGDRQTR